MFSEQLMCRRNMSYGDLRFGYLLPLEIARCDKELEEPATT